MRQQTVEQRTAPIACRRMYHQTGRLVQHQDRIVFINNIQIHRLGCEGKHFLAFLNGYLQLFAADHFFFGLGTLAVYRYRTVFNPRGQAAARVIGQ